MGRCHTRGYRDAPSGPKLGTMTLRVDAQRSAHRAHRRTQRTAPLPGLALCAAGAAAAIGLGRLQPAVSPLLIAIVLGALLANLARVPAAAGPGVAVASRSLLRIGIALLGLNLVLSDILGLGWRVIVVVTMVVALGVAGTLYAGHALGIGWRQRVLIACGFSICGAAAVAAVDGVVEADEDEVSTAVALVVIFGTLMIPLAPLLVHALGLSEAAAGMWAGASVHEVAQVVAAGGAIGGTALAVAVVVKLARVLMLAPVVAAVSLWQRRIAVETGSRRPPIVPLFIVGFLACVAVRSAGVVGPDVLALAGGVQTVLLTAAMFALGTGVRVAALRGVGAKPFLLAGAATVWVAGIALVGVLWAGVSG